MNTINLSKYIPRGIINKIYIDSLPKGLYEMRINNLWFIKLTGSIINFSNNQSENNNPLQIQYFDILKSIAIGQNEPVIPNRNDYLNFSRVGSVILTCPNNLSAIELDPLYIVRVTGWFDDYSDGNWVNTTKFVIVQIEHKAI